MKFRNLVIPGLILLIATVYIQGGLAAPGDNNSPNDFYRVELFDLKKRGSCDSTKYTITNIDNYRITTAHNFTNNDGLDVFTFNSNIDYGETKTYDLSSMDSLPQDFTGDVLVKSTGEITGTKLPFPPCGISIDGPPFGSININTPYTFTATVTPEDALLPITITWYEWNAETQDWYIIGIGDSVELYWTTGGWKQLHVSAENSIGSVNVQVFIYVNLEQIFLPITIK
jgi:hypothetical protein